jgi:hypothetical protein
MLGTPNQGAGEDGDTVVGPVSDNIELFLITSITRSEGDGNQALGLGTEFGPSAFDGIVRHRPSGTGRITAPDAR